MPPSGLGGKESSPVDVTAILHAVSAALGIFFCLYMRPLRHGGQLTCPQDLSPSVVGRGLSFQPLPLELVPLLTAGESFAAQVPFPFCLVFFF